MVGADASPDSQSGDPSSSWGDSDWADAFAGEETDTPGPTLSTSSPGSSTPAALPDFPIAPSNGNGLDLGSVPATGRVTGADVIQSSTGAVTGFPVVRGCDLSVPGPFNDTTTNGTCTLVFQVKFHLAGIPSSEVALTRKVTRTATVTIGGAQKQDIHNGPDGPSAPTVLKPDGSTVVVSDSPGYFGSGAKNIFPVTYHADFELYAYDLVAGKVLAKLTYTVDIVKKTFGDSSPTTTLTNLVQKFYP
jgi:hypothetical protein